jgi:hypothetical protein
MVEAGPAVVDETFPVEPTPEAVASAGRKGSGPLFAWLGSGAPRSFRSFVGFLAQVRFLQVINHRVVSSPFSSCSFNHEPVTSAGSGGASLSSPSSFRYGFLNSLELY